MNRRRLIVLGVGGFIILLGIIFAASRPNSPSGSIGSAGNSGQNQPNGPGTSNNSLNGSSSSSSSGVGLSSGSGSNSSSPSGNNGSSSTATDQQLTDAINASGVLSNAPDKNFTITDSSEPVDGWYLADIQPSNGGDPATVILKKNPNGTLSVVAGPGSTFSANDLQAQGVPKIVIGKISTLASSISSSSNNGTLSQDQRDALAGGILYFNTDDTACSQSNGSMSITATNLTGNSNAQKVFNYFTQTRGLSATVAAAIVGNLVQEHGVVADSNGGGLAQWGGSRWSNLVTYAGAKGEPVNDLGTQLDFMSVELGLIPPAGGVPGGGYKHVLDQMQNMTDIVQATGTFMGTYAIGSTIPGTSVKYDPDPAAVAFVNKYGVVAGYEGPSIPQLGNRIAAAEGALGFSNNHATGSVTISATSTGCPGGSATGSGVAGGPAVPGSSLTGNCQGTMTQLVNCGSCVIYVQTILSKHLKGYNGIGPGNGVAIAGNLSTMYHVPLNHTPAVHSIASWGPPQTSSGDGHVALVSGVQVDSSGKVTAITVEDSNYHTPWDNLYRQRTITNPDMINNGNYAHTESLWQ